MSHGGPTPLRQRSPTPKERWRASPTAHRAGAIDVASSVAELAAAADRLSDAIERTLGLRAEFEDHVVDPEPRVRVEERGHLIDRAEEHGRVVAAAIVRRVWVAHRDADGPSKRRGVPSL